MPIDLGDSILLTIHQLLPRGHSSVDDNVLPCHIRTGIARQKHTGAPQIVWVGHSAQHDLTLPTFKQLRELGGCQSYPLHNGGTYVGGHFCSHVAR